MDITSVLGSASTVVSLSEKLVQLVETARAEDKNVRLTRLISELDTSAVELCHDLREDLRVIRVDLSSAGVDVDSTLGELHEDLRWYNFVTRNRLKRFEKSFSGIYLSLSAFIDDISSVLICTGSVDTMHNALREGLELQTQLNRVLDSDRTLGEILGEISAVMDSIYRRLRDSRGPSPSAPGGSVPPGGGSGERAVQEVEDWPAEEEILEVEEEQEEELAQEKLEFMY